jgi:hypothetical protein
MAKRFVALIAASTPVLAIGSVAFAQLASRGTIADLQQGVQSSGVSRDAQGVGDSQSFQLALLQAQGGGGGAGGADTSTEQAEAQMLAQMINLRFRPCRTRRRPTSPTPSTTPS